ncbi:MAG: sigma 54-interacting transcriptional regulator, partial [Actinobacteria bacterium]|nr:sigma 54-interacting transcriptional regulator [Actinomycetota bacterium]
MQRLNSSILSDILNYLPSTILADSFGIISWTNKIDIAPGSNILDLIPDLDLQGSGLKPSLSLAVIDEISFIINSYPLEDDSGILFYLEPLESKAISMLIENPYEGFLLVDKQGIIRMINETLANYLKVPKKKLVGQHFDKYSIDPGLHGIIETQKPDLLSIFSASRNLVASRHPVFHDGNFVGAYGRYFSIDSRDLKENIFGDGYINVLEGLQIGSINQAMMELTAYKNEFYDKHTSSFGIENIVGSSPIMRELKKNILMIWDSPSSVLLTGESGTGKEVFAQAIHFHSDRSQYPFVKVNCAAIPETLLEAELFGYVEGAFTGARKGGKMGKFELANKGVIFLDEIGDMPLTMQAKLLRVLQEKEIERLGSEQVIPIDVRVVSATNKDLYAMTAQGTFRADLFYRLNVINFHIPALRERRSDIPELVDYFIRALDLKLNRNIKSVAPEVMERFLAYDWPGNVRELINILESAMNFCRDNTLGLKELPHFLITNIDTGSMEDDSLLAT